MIYESIELLFAKMKEQKSLIGRMDLAFVLLNRDEKDNIDFCPLQQSVLPDLMVELEEVEQEIQSRIENDELRVYSILLDKKSEEYFSSYMDCSNTYFADASNRLAKVMEQLIDNMNMVSKSSERARIGYEKSYHGTISWERASKIAQKKLK